MTEQPMPEVDSLELASRTMGAAIKVFSEAGFDATTLELVAIEARLSVEQILVQYTSKEDLHEAMMRELMCWAHEVPCRL